MNGQNVSFLNFVWWKSINFRHIKYVVKLKKNHHNYLLVCFYLMIKNDLNNICTSRINAHQSSIHLQPIQIHSYNRTRFCWNVLTHRNDSELAIKKEENIMFYKRRNFETWKRDWVKDSHQFSRLFKATQLHSMYL